MKNRSLIHWLWLGLMIGLLNAAPAHAFYNPQQGRWLNRDPIGERGGFNLNAFVENDSISKIDPLGLADELVEMWPAKHGVQNFIVHKCAIVIVMGHASEEYPHRFFFDKGFEACSGAGVTGCGSITSNVQIPPDAKIPGTPDHKDTVMSSDPEYQKGIDNTRTGAVTKAGEMCKQCCKEVKIYYFDAPKNDKLEDALYQNKKPMIEIYSCVAGKITKTINNHFLEDRAKAK